MTMEPTQPGQPESQATPEPEAAPEKQSAPAPMPAAPPPMPPATPAWQAPTEPTGPFPGLKFADHGKRLVAYIIDGLIIAGLVILVTVVFSVIGVIFAAADSGVLAGISFLVLFITVFVISLAYFPYFWVKSGQTPGMQVMGGLRVVRDKDGGPITIGPAILRLIGFWIDSLVFYLGFIWILIDSRRRGWHDLIAGTVVVQKE